MSELNSEKRENNGVMLEVIAKMALFIGVVAIMTVGLILQEGKTAQAPTVDNGGSVVEEPAPAPAPEISK